MDTGVNIVLHHVLAENDGILKVITAPRHEGDHHVAPQRQFPGFGGGAVRQNITLGDLLAFLDDRPLVDVGRGVRTHVLEQPVFVAKVVFSGHLAIFGDDDAIRIDRGDNAIVKGRDDRAGAAGNLFFKAGADVRGIGHQQGNRLALHVRSHQGTVGVIVLKERDQPGRRADQLLGRNIHVGDVLRRIFLVVATATAKHEFLDKATILVQLGIRLGNDEILLFVAREIFHLIRNPAGNHLAVRSLDKAIVIDPAIEGQG